jgi:hypothetical protein
MVAVARNASPIYLEVATQIGVSRSRILFEVIHLACPAMRRAYACRLNATTLPPAVPSQCLPHASMSSRRRASASDRR